VTALFLLLRPGAPPPLGFLLVFIPLVFLGVTWISNHLLGIPALYKAWPADLADPIERRVGWQQVEFGAFRGHCPMSIRFGQRCLHLKQPFPFQPAWWLGPASVPWEDVLLVKAPSSSWWAFLRAAEFTLGNGARMIRLRGKAADLLLAEVQRRQGRYLQGPTPAVMGPGAIRPR